MLKRKEAASQPQDFTDNSRVTWDLMVERQKKEDAERFAIARIEQLYPRPVAEIEAEIAHYPQLKTVRWVQDEPANMGPWPHYALNVWPDLDVDVEPITREESSSPSVGTMKRHTAEQKDLLDRALS
jgi:2-oxoglutarate dehydrogenase E1 component